mmetsp:Transcript_44946/g.101501  ORF Transcript_44946/g.101501 Transcript_44946/m.101501 type:complete len:202 (+) Transcript_44946:53-658(+)
MTFLQVSENPADILQDIIASCKSRRHQAQLAQEPHPVGKHRIYQGCPVVGGRAAKCRHRAVEPVSAAHDEGKERPPQQRASTRARDIAPSTCECGEPAPRKAGKYARRKAHRWVEADTEMAEANSERSDQRPHKNGRLTLAYSAHLDGVSQSKASEDQQRCGDSFRGERGWHHRHCGRDHGHACDGQAFNSGACEGGASTL